MADRSPARRAPRKATPTPPEKQPSPFSSGFATVKEVLSYVLGAATLIYGVTLAPADKAYFAVGSGLALLGFPIVGSVFGKKD